MKTAIILSAVGALAAASGAAQAEEFGRVVSATPVIQQVAVPRQVCNVQQVATQPQGGGAGAVLGAIVGGVLGNQVGHGMGRAAATGLGVVAGAAIGDNASNNGYRTQNVQQCSTQTTYENRATAYNVTYEYAGKQYTVQMPNDPGPTIRLQLTPVGTNTTAPAGIIQSEGESYLPQTVAVSPQAVPEASVGYPVYSQPYYSQPYYAQPYYQPYYAPIGLSIGLGYSSGGYRGGHRHWR